MAAKRGKSQAKRGGSKSGVPAWIWLLAGVLLGLGLSAFVLLREGHDPRRDAPTPNPSARAPREPEAPVAQQSPPKTEPRETKPRFDFYTVLAEREVQIPDSELAAQAQAEASQPKPAESIQYLLQAGAFGNAADAEAVKARLALTGMVARVETGSANNKPIFRVRLGPYASASALAEAKRQLADNGIGDAIAIRADR
jgi:cell division protein FtsN